MGIKTSNKAFTLAETLITLVIIGIIAALVMPTILQNYDKMVTEVQFKEANSLLANAVKRAESDYGAPQTWDYALSSTDFAKTYLIPYLHVAKVCGTTSTGTDCFAGVNNSWYNINNVSSNSYSGGYDTRFYYKFLLNNGMGIGVWRNVTTFSNIVIDINGAKGYSKVGKDVFDFSVSQTYGFRQGLPLNYYSKTIPELLSASIIAGCNKDATNGGVHYYNIIGAECTLAIVKNGGRIPDSYPWDDASSKP